MRNAKPIPLFGRYKQIGLGQFPRHHRLGHMGPNGGLYKAPLFGNLGNAVAAYKEICAEKKKPVRKVKCSYFIHVGDKPGDDEKAQERMINYITMAGLRKTMSQGGTGPLPDSMQYFKQIGAALNDPKKGDFDDNSMLFGSPQRIIDSLKKVEAVGIDEVILYFNFGNAPDSQVRDTMHRFAEEIAPAFADSKMALREPAE